MPQEVLYALWCLGAYLLGAIPFGWLLGKVKGVDLRQEGSRNIGATNAGRVLGKKYFFLVLLLDFAKGFLPVWSALSFSSTPLLPVGVGLFAILGHLFPIYLGFRGGKGVATSAGVFAALTPYPFFVALSIWLTLLLGTGYMSLASLGGAASLAFSAIFLSPDPWGRDLAQSLFCLLAALLVFLRHHENIGRLWRGEENPSPLFGRSSEEGEEASSAESSEHTCSH